MQKRIIGALWVAGLYFLIVGIATKKIALILLCVLFIAIAIFVKWLNTEEPEKRKEADPESRNGKNQAVPVITNDAKVGGHNKYAQNQQAERSAEPKPPEMLPEKKRIPTEDSVKAHSPIEVNGHLKALMETVESEGLSVLICDVEDGEKGFIFDHLRQPYSTVLTRTGHSFWHVYYSDGTKIKPENIHVVYSLQEACRTALRLARNAEENSEERNSKTKHHLMYWNLDAKGTLTLSGEGPMPCFGVPRHDRVSHMQIAYEARGGNPNLPKEGDIQSRTVVPWVGSNVRKVVIAPGLTTLCDGAFSSYTSADGPVYYSGNYENLTEIILPNTMKKLGKRSVECCWNLRKVVIPDSVTSIYEDEYSFVFKNCGRGLSIQTTSGSYAEKYAKRKGIATVTCSNGRA